MNKKALLQKIKHQAQLDARKRQDPRFKTTMGFLVAKGFLQTNYQVPSLPNIRLKVDDAIWAGVNVEPRILEVLPAAILRLEKHFDLDPVRHRDLATTVHDLREQKDVGQDFLGAPFEKLKRWANLKLKDKRTKKPTDKKVVKTFRLNPAVVDKIRQLATKEKITETAVIERVILHLRFFK